MDWLDLFSIVKVTHLLVVSSDYTPVLLSIYLNERKENKSSFRFQAAWVLHDSFLDVVADAWKKGNSVHDKIKATEQVLTTWNKNVFGNIHWKKKRLEARLGGIQRKFGICRSNNLIKLEAKLKKELEEVLYQEELLWYQRSMEEWITLGDRNTKYYHAATKVRRAMKTIHALMNDNGELETDAGRVQDLVYNYFSRIFKMEDNTHQVRPIPNGFPAITDRISLCLCRDVTKEEVKAALFDMSPYKATGPDGFHAGFYQHTWSIIGDDITDMVRDFLCTGRVWDGVNDTFLSLISKVKTPDNVAQLRLISLCNVKYKIVTKVITNRLKGFLGEVISQEHSSFVPKRQIVDNIVIYQEVLHSMRNKKSNKGYMVLKIDLQKAYDRLSWTFLRETLQEVGMNQQWVNNIMACVEIPGLDVLWNWKQFDWINLGEESAKGTRCLCISLFFTLRGSVILSRQKWQKDTGKASKRPGMAHKSLIYFLLTIWSYLQSQQKNK